MSQPPGVTKFYYLSAYACLNNDSVRYFGDTMSCSTLTKMTMPVPSSPKANGASCPANPQNRQPSCGNPIAIGTGNKVQQEVDGGGANHDRAQLPQQDSAGRVEE